MISSVTIKNTIMYNYQSEGFLLSSNAQTNTLAFSMVNNTLYQCGKDGAYSWCTISAGSGAVSTYNISNNIISKSYLPVSKRSTILVPVETGTNYFADAANFDFSLSTSLPYKDTDNNYLGAPRWLPVQGTSVSEIKQLQLKTNVINGKISIELSERIKNIEMYSINGNRMFTKDMHEYKTQINTTDIVKRVYILKIRTENKTVTQKISF